MGLSCSQCVAAPQLQDLQGCFVPTPRPFAVLDGFEFTRCPITYQSPGSLEILIGALSGEAEQLDRWAMTEKRLCALRYAAKLLDETRTSSDDR